LASLESQS
nr:Chain B, COPII-binding peptide of the protein transport protein BET1 [synthetic construct]